MTREGVTRVFNGQAYEHAALRAEVSYYRSHMREGVAR